MEQVVDIIQSAYQNYAGYLWRELLHPHWKNYIYWLIALSLLAWGLELIAPWRKNQQAIRKDFWLDGFYMFFNFFLFSLIGFNALSSVGVHFTDKVLLSVGIDNQLPRLVGTLPKGIQLVIFFLVSDFVQWNVHRALHKFNWLWRFHKVHHSVKQMGFAAHLRYHWMESIVYKSVLYLPFTILGYTIEDYFIIHICAIAIGHLNHSNLGWDYGPLKYVLNNPKMHIWHHAKVWPDGRVSGNYGITLSLWDYLFGTASIPADGRDIELGFEGDEDYPEGFVGQSLEPFRKE